MKEVHLHHNYSSSAYMHACMNELRNDNHHNETCLIMMIVVSEFIHASQWKMLAVQFPIMQCSPPA